MLFLSVLALFTTRISGRTTIEYHQKVVDVHIPNTESFGATAAVFEIAPVKYGCFELSGECVTTGDITDLTKLKFRVNRMEVLQEIGSRGHDSVFSTESTITVKDKFGLRLLKMTIEMDSDYLYHNYIISSDYLTIICSNGKFLERETCVENPSCDGGYSGLAFENGIARYLCGDETMEADIQCFGSALTGINVEGERVYFLCGVYEDFSITVLDGKLKLNGINPIDIYFKIDGSWIRADKLESYSFMEHDYEIKTSFGKKLFVKSKTSELEVTEIVHNSENAKEKNPAPYSILSAVWNILLMISASFASATIIGLAFLSHIKYLEKANTKAKSTKEDLQNAPEPMKGDVEIETNEITADKKTLSFRFPSHLKLEKSDFSSIGTQYGELSDLKASQMGFEGVSFRIYHQSETSSFEHELSVIAQLRHKNVVELVGFFDHTIVTKRYETSLHNMIYGSNFVKRPTKKQIIEDIVQGMIEVHRLGIIHLNLNPYSILFNGRAVVSDFGYSAVIGHPRQNLVVPLYDSTISYCSPEYFERINYVFTDPQEQDKLIDVYAFGIILYEIVTGEKVWDGIEMSMISSMIKLEQGKHDDLYSEMIKSCWRQIYSERPTFKTLEQKLLKE